MPDLRERLVALANETIVRTTGFLQGRTRLSREEVAIAAARMALEDAAQICVDVPVRDDYWRRATCVAIRALATKLAR